MNQKFFTILLTVLLFHCGAYAQFQVTDVQSSGDGCPSGSVQAQLAPDGSAVTVLYDRLVLQTTPGSPNGRTNCEVTITVKKPLMMGFTIDSADFRGFIALDAGMAAEQRVSVSTAPVKELRDIAAEFGMQSFRGPIQQDYTLRTVRPVRGTEVLNCAPPREITKIVIKTDLRIAARQSNGAGQFTVDSVDGKVRQIYKLRRQDCAQQIANTLGAIISFFGKRR